MSRDGSGALAAPIFEMPSLARALDPTMAGQASAPSFDDVYAAHVAFVWRVLRTLGISDAQIEDAVQDVFVVVHRRLCEFEGRAAITTWLFAIARRVASAYRRRAAATSSRTEALHDDDHAAHTDTFADMSRAQAATTVLEILQQLDEDKRVVFALVELEQLSVPEVAQILDLNLNTAYSRLRLARRAFELAVRAKVTP
jgi:RNA polymerase sigma-70 factor, ECF subfamily